MLTLRNLMLAALVLGLMNWQPVAPPVAADSAESGEYGKPKPRPKPGEESPPRPRPKPGPRGEGEDE